MKMKNRWTLHFGHKGKRFYTFDECLEVCVYEDALARERRFFVLEMSQVKSRHEHLNEAQAEVLKRLIQS
jgi:hypothetical protein